MNEIHLGSHVQTTKGVSDERSTLVSAHPSQRYKRREEHTCEVCILSNVIVGDGNPKTREIRSVSILINAQAMKGAYVRSMHPNQRKGGR